MAVRESRSLFCNLSFSFLANTEYSRFLVLIFLKKKKKQKQLIDLDLDTATVFPNAEQIRIGNRIDNNGATNPVCRTGQSIAQGKTVTYTCAYMRGRYVSIFKYNNDVSATFSAQN